MGTESPELGKHCSVGDCHQPFTCDYCNQVFCLEHRSYVKHNCPKANKQDVTVVICPLCAKGVCLIPNEDPNITWESHVNTECDPSNYEKATKKKRCAVLGCREILCLEHKSYVKHNCPKAHKLDVTVVICPLCAEGVPLIPDEDPNITWESHVNTKCDPSNYEKATKEKRCPVPGCIEILTFSNMIRCRDCAIDHCLNHRFGLDHKCPGPKKPHSGFPFIGLLNWSQSRPSNSPSVSSSPKWTTSFLDAASSFKASAEAGMAKLSIATNHALQMAKDGIGPSSGSSEHVEECPQCQAKFMSVSSLTDHVERAWLSKRPLRWQDSFSTALF